MRLAVLQVDAFTDRPLTGNPAAVIELARWPDDALLQAIAREMNLSETAYVIPRDDGFALRWFTPAREVELCGHATLASAHALWELGRTPLAEPVRFHTRYHGELPCIREPSGAITLDFPAIRPTPTTAVGLAEALGVRPIAVYKSRYDLIAELEDASQVRALTPDFSAIARLEARGVAVTARGDHDGVDIVSRFFVPKFDINEDPVTGSLHCALGPLWCERLGVTTLRAEQASARGGRLEVCVHGDRVALRGRAVTVMRGELELGELGAAL